MLISDKLILVEMLKSGTMPLKRFLGEVVGGETSGKSLIFAGELTERGVPVVGVVCNPLTWYLSEWRLGCSGKGELYKRLTDAKRWDVTRARRTNRQGKLEQTSTGAASTEGQAKPEAKPKEAKSDPKAIPENWSADYAKSHWYADSNNVEAFREWLRAVLATRGLRFLLDRGYQVSPVSNLGGPLTYQFVIRFIREGENLDKSTDSLEALKALNARDNITPHFIRMESAGEDLLNVLDALGVTLTEAQRKEALELKRRGVDAKTLRTYYDDESLRLIAHREAFISQLFGYEGVEPGEGKAEGAKAGKKAKAKAAQAGTSESAGKKKDKGQAGKAAGAGKLSKEDKELKRQSRAERQAKKAAATGEGAGAPSAEVAGKSKAKSTKAASAAAQESPGSAQDKPVKLKRIKTRAPDEDVFDTDE